MAYYGYGSRWPKYVSVGQRQSRAKKKVEQLRKKGLKVQPIEIEGRKIVKTFWGQAWCDQMESLGDYENRLPRGRSYVRNGSVCHLEISKGRVLAMVSGSSLYNVKVDIDVFPKEDWSQLRKRCAGQIGSLLELLQGKLSSSVMEVVTDPQKGLFPSESEIHLDCNCPDWAHLCKHLAAVLYGIGARLDRNPELLFLLRGVNHEELIEESAIQSVNRVTRGKAGRRLVAGSDLEDMFGIDLNEDSDSVADSPQAAKHKKTRGKKKAKKKKPAKRASGKTSSRKTSKSTKKKKSAKTAENSGKKVKKKTSRKKTVPDKVSVKKTKKKVIAKKKPTRKKVTAKNVTAKKTIAKKVVAKKRVAKKKKTARRSVTKASLKKKSAAEKRKKTVKAKAAKTKKRKPKPR